MTTVLPRIVAMRTEFDLEGSWETFWDAVKKGSTIDPILNVVSVVGVIIVVGALIGWAWERRRGGGGGFGQQSSKIWGALLVGCLFSAPQVIIPMLLLVLDVVANAALNIWNDTAA